jgi:hypothetical protein
MKHPFTIYDLRFTIWKKSGRAGSPLPAANTQQRRARSDAPYLSQRSLQPLAFSIQPSQRGVALIITLILLGVVTFMAIAFLALSRRERGAVTTVTDTASARLAADTALAGAEAQIVANALSTTNPCNFGLLVSTNYINPAGFTNGGLNDVNYYDSSGNFLTGNSFLQNLANLYYSPRPPVFIVTNQLTGGTDFRFYLDLNRNAKFDANGLLPVISPDPANPYYDTNGNTRPNIIPGNTLSNLMVGDPEWIGILQRPDQPYGPNNPFVARYAFIALPIGNTLDLNAIHNQAMTKTVNPDATTHVSDGYFRNQGVGSWEINLAAFLTDLNANQWDTSTDPYTYLQPANGNTGRGFEDALSLLSYRYGYNYNSLTNAAALLNGASGLANGNIDGYSDWTLMTTPAGINVINQTVSGPGAGWAGADNTNHFFTPEELFNPNESSTLFVNSLLAAGNTNSTYDRYTFYRLLSQLGTDSTPDSGKMNLNYDNLDPYTNGVASSTNFMTWQPVAFFTNAADRLLRAYTTQWRTGNPTNFANEFYSVTDFTFTNPDQWTNYPAFGIGHIPVLVSNRFVYSSAVNRLLQLAANLYDATTTNFYPSVFRPRFTRDSGGNVFVTGYTYVPSVTGANDLSVFTQPFDASTISALVGVTTLASNVNVYGVPWIIGAKKGFPNFNKFALQDVVQITRKLQITRATLTTTSTTNLINTNQMYIFSISNSIGMDLWNSYSNWYPNPVQIVVNGNLSMMLTNDSLLSPQYGPSNYSITANIPFAANPSWPGSAWDPRLYGSSPANGNSMSMLSGSPSVNSFIVPINNTVVFLTNNIFYSGTTPPGVSGFHSEGENLGWETSNHAFTLPNFYLLMTNRLQVFMLDGSHVIDYVQFAGPNSRRNLTAEFQTNSNVTGYGGIWETNLNGNNVPSGIINQINIADGQGGVSWDSAYWGAGSAPDEMSGFADFMGYGNGSSVSPYYATNYIVQVPYSPTVTACEYISWQANDPLVHYLAGDLNFQGKDSGGLMTSPPIIVSTKIASLPKPSFTQWNERYQPWGLSQQMANTGDVDPNPVNWAFKDPLVCYSDDWDFPANKFPTAGWLGRVHRGTPWQTVFLKATNVLAESSIGANTWAQWTSDTQLTFNQYFDAINSAPVQDRLLFDLFTTAFNDNATRGTLSANQGTGSSDPLAGLAAWSAVFSSSVALSNNAADDTIRYRPQHQNSTISNTFVFIQPAGPDGINSALGQLVAGINQTRATFTNADGLVGTFEHAGDILSVPQLTEQFPFLNWNDGVQQANGISDEMYEWLPQQTMSLLRGSSSPRYVIYCYGQTLKPAADSVVNSSSALPSGLNPFGMITNYQVVSEIATRAVVRFNSTVTGLITNTPPDPFGNVNWYSLPVVTSNNAVIESFNILPPD